MKRKLALVVVALVLAITSVNAKGMEGWEPVTGEDGSAIDVASMSLYGDSVYALDTSGAAYLMGKGVAKPVKSADGKTIAFHSLCEVGRSVLGAEASDSKKHNAWKLAGTTATPVLDGSGEQLVTPAAFSTPQFGARGCPYFWTHAGGSAGGAPPGMSVSVDMYWLNGDKAQPVPLPELKAPVFLWTGKHLLMTNRGKTHIFVDGELKDLAWEGREPWVSANDMACDDYIMLNSGVHLYRIEGETAKELSLQTTGTRKALFQLDGAPHIWLSNGSDSNEFVKLEGDEAKPTEYTKLLAKGKFRKFHFPDGVAVAEAIEAGKTDVQFLVMRDGKGKTVKLPKDAWSMGISRFEAAFGGQYVMLAGSAPAAVWVLDTKNKLKVVACPESKFAIDRESFVFGQDGIYQHFSAEDRTRSFIYHAMP
ncbi:MAG: hypothetical protein KDB90_14785 [Planctomycetes bacterium]|nr:hypothetical protein [Planctomycetota bacterium]